MSETTSQDEGWIHEGRPAVRFLLVRVEKNVPVSIVTGDIQRLAMHLLHKKFASEAEELVSLESISDAPHWLNRPTVYMQRECNCPQSVTGWFVAI